MSMQLGQIGGGGAQSSPLDRDPKLGIGKLVLIGALVIGGFFIGLGGWAAFVPLKSAAIAIGQVTVDGRRKTIQHLEGGIVREIVEQRVVRILFSESSDVRAVKERSRVALAGVAEGPRGVAVGCRDRHLDGVFHAVAPSGVLDEPNSLSDRRAGVPFQAKGERKVEEHLRVGGALDLGIEAGLDGHGQITLHLREIREDPVVHPEPPAVAERVAVRLLNGCARRGTDMCENAAGRGLPCELAQVAVVPGRLRAVEDSGKRSVAVPADAEPVPVGGLDSHACVFALHDEGVGGFVEEVIQSHGRT